MALEVMQVGDIGTIIRVTVQDLQADGTVVTLDVSLATTQQFRILKPDDTELTVTTSFTTDGTDGLIEYATLDGDINQSGKYKLQAYLVFPTGTWSTDVGTFNVCKNLF